MQKKDLAHEKLAKGNYDLDVTGIRRAEGGTMLKFIISLISVQAIILLFFYARGER